MNQESLILAQLELEHKYAKSAVNFKLWEQVSPELELITLFESIEVAKAILITTIKYPRGLNIQAWISDIKSFGFTLEQATSFLEEYSNIGVFEIVLHPSGSYTVMPHITLSKPVHREIMANATVLPPMLIKPRKWNSRGFNGGYLTVKHKAILGSKNQHNKPINTKALNKLQNISWKLNTSVVTNFIDETSYDKDIATTVTADLLGQDFYFMWQYDKRGRMYSKGYEINLQSSEYHKAMLDFSNGEKPTDATIEGLLIGIAEALGKDKLTWKERIKYASHWLIDNVDKTSEELTIDLSEAVSPMLLTKYVEAYYDALEGLEVFTPVAIDSTASGLQCLAVLTGCESTAKAVNIINTGVREDVYTWLISAMNALLLPEDQITTDLRDNAKQALMTFWYGSKAVPERMFNKNQLEAFYKAMDGVFTGPMMYMDAVADAWSSKEEYVWTLPDGHTAVVRTTELSEITIQLEGSDVPFVYEERVVQATKGNLHLFANIVHSIDAYVARELIMRCDFEVAAIHDSFWCLPSNVFKMKAVYQQIMQEIADSNLLSSILSEIAGYNIKFNKLANINVDGEYCLS